jgi:hypothetical protein
VQKHTPAEDYYYQQLPDSTKGKTLTAMAKLPELTPTKLKPGAKNFGEILDKLLPQPLNQSESRREIYKQTSESGNRNRTKMNCIVASIFPPVKVGNLAGTFVSDTYEGDIFPQFTPTVEMRNGGVKKCDLECNLCEHYNDFRMAYNVKGSALRKKTSDNGKLNKCQGIKQSAQHHKSPSHQEAITFFTSNVKEVEGYVPSTSRKDTQQLTVTDYFHKNIASSNRKPKN